MSHYVKCWSAANCTTGFKENASQNFHKALVEPYVRIVSLRLIGGFYGTLWVQRDPILSTSRSETDLHTHFVPLLEIWSRVLDTLPK